MNTLIAPDLHPTAIQVCESHTHMDILGLDLDLDPISELGTDVAIPPVLSAACSIDAWRVSRGLWATHDGDGAEQVRTDVKLAVQSADMVNQMCAEGTEPHPVVMMLTSSDPLEISKDLFDKARREFEHEVERITLNAVLAVATVTLAGCVALAVDYILGL